MFGGGMGRGGGGGGGGGGGECLKLGHTQREAVLET